MESLVETKTKQSDVEWLLDMFEEARVEMESKAECNTFSFDERLNNVSLLILEIVFTRLLENFKDHKLSMFRMLVLRKCEEDNMPEGKRIPLRFWTDELDDCLFNLVRIREASKESLLDYEIDLFINILKYYLFLQDLEFLKKIVI